MRILRILFGIWGLLWFVLPFLLMLPFLHLFAQKVKWHHYASFLNKLWAKIFFTACLIPYQIEYRFRPRKNQPYVYCANHTSLIDIVAMGLVVRGNHTFVGKEELTKVPLFGSMYAKLHIPFNRESRISGYKALIRSMEAIDQGKSVIIFPEGGIFGNHPPVMNPFKEGPFRIAIEKQVSIVPVTLLYNWIILRDDDKYLANWHRGKAIVHQAIETKGMTVQDIEKLKEQTFEIINQELKKHCPEAYQETKV